jgi:hypothetical protein
MTKSTRHQNYKILLRLQGLPSTTNSGGRRHWAIKVKENRAWGLYMRSQLLEAGLPERPLMKAKLTLTRCSSAEPDFDGLVSSFKILIDHLVKNGVIIDDRSSVIGQPTYLWKKERPTMGHILIEVEGIE